MSRAFEGSIEGLAKRPFLVITLRQLDAEQLRSLETLPLVPVPLIRSVVHKRSIATLAPVLVLAFHGGEVPILVDIIREHKQRRAGYAAEVGGRLSRELADQLWGTNRGRRVGRLRVILEVEGVELRAVFALYNVPEGSFVNPEEMTTFGELRRTSGRVARKKLDTHGKLQRLGIRFQCDDHNRLVVPTQQPELERIRRSERRLTSSLQSRTC